MPPSPTVHDAAARQPDPTWLLAALLLGGALISGFTMLQGIDPFDEGLALQAGRRILAGQTLYRDFRWAYGPAQPYLLAGLFKLFGVSLLQWRIPRALADGAVALLAYLIVAQRAPRPLALGCWLAVACEMAQPRSANPFPYALLAVLVALWLAGTRSAAPATVREVLPLALLTALAAAFRFDFAVYGLAAVSVVLAVRGGLRAALRYALAAVGLGALVYLPFAIIVGPGSLYHELVGVSLSTGAYWSLPFPWSYHAPAGAGIGKTIKHAIDFYVPLMCIAGFALLIAVSAARTWRTRRAPAIEAGLIVLGAGMLAYLLSRADEFHTQPLFVIAAIGLALCGSGLGHRRAVGIARRAAAGVAVVLLGLLLIHGAANRLSALIRPPSEATLRIAVADGVMASPAREPPRSMRWSRSCRRTRRRARRSLYCRAARTLSRSPIRSSTCSPSATTPARSTTACRPAPPRRRRSCGCSSACAPGSSCAGPIRCHRGLSERTCAGAPAASTRSIAGSPSTTGRWRGCITTWFLSRAAQARLCEQAATSERSAVHVVLWRAGSKRAHGPDLRIDSRRGMLGDRLHILILSDRDWTHPQGGGTGTNLYSQVWRWVGWGHRVSVIACSYPGAAACERLGPLTLHRIGGLDGLPARHLARSAPAHARRRRHARG